MTISDDSTDLNLNSNELDKIAKESIAIPEVKEEEDLDKIVDAILAGETAFFVDKANKALLSTRGWPTRGVAEPHTETVVRGPRDGFTKP